MIDRNRVRELANRKPPLTRLAEFLEQSEPDVQTIEGLMAALEILQARARDPFQVLVSRCIAQDQLRLSDERFEQLEHRTAEALKECRIHGNIAELRWRTRGTISDERFELGERLARVERTFERFLTLCEKVRPCWELRTC